MIKRIIFVVLFITATINANTLKNEKQVEELAKNTMEFIGKGDINRAFEFISSNITIPNAEVETIKQKLLMQAPVFRKRFGKILGYEHISTKKVGNSLIKIVYIQKFEKHIMPWEFYFYKPKDEWILDAFWTYDNIKLFFNNN